MFVIKHMIYLVTEMCYTERGIIGSKALSIAILGPGPNICALICFICCLNESLFSDSSGHLNGAYAMNEIPTNKMPKKTAGVGTRDMGTTQMVYPC
jgi:hypothetical protein